MIYAVTIDGRDHVIEIDGDRVVVDGRRVEARVEFVAGTPEVRIVIDGLATVLGVESGRDETWRLVDRGAIREVTVQDERSRRIRQLAGAPRAGGGHAVLKAPMPGLVLRVLVSVGDQVEVGRPLLSLEAMKMENELKAAGAGQVTAVLVSPGQAVEKGAPLLELGPVGLPQDVVPE
ncbi:MAG: biotin/lipoyl-containing protein [Gemmatimonadales bacterium]